MSDFLRSCSDADLDRYINANGNNCFGEACRKERARRRDVRDLDEAQRGRAAAIAERDEALANLKACRQERGHWLTVATQAQGELDAAKAAIATTPRPLPGREAIAESIARGLQIIGPGAAFTSLLPDVQAHYIAAADHVLELLRPYALGQPANELDYRVSAEELAERLQRYADTGGAGPLTPSGWRVIARMVAGVLGVNLRKADAAAEPAPPAEAADLPASLGAPKTWEAPVVLASERAESWAELDARLAKVEAMAHMTVPMAHADDVELIWTFISRVDECGVIESARRALQHRRAVRSQLALAARARR